MAPIDPPRRLVAAAAVAVAFTGMAALASQLAWTRVLALIVGPTSYAFGAMLATFIAGLAVGAAAGAALARRARFPALWLAVSAASAGCSVIGVAPIVNRLPLVIAEAASVAAPGQLYIVGPLITALAAIVPMAVGFGACLPLGFAVAAGHRERAPRIAAVLVAANTVGAVAGSLGAGFALLPALGIERSFDVVAVFAAAGAVAAALAIPGRLRLASFGLAVLPVVAAWAGPVWDRDLLFGGAYKYGRYVDGIDAESALRAGTWLFRAEGRVGAVSVRRTAGVVALAIDGKVDASSGGDMLTQQLLGHLPLLLHPNPRKVAIVGLGSGVTLGAALQHPLERADVVELAPEVVRAAAYFDAWHHGALGDPRTRLIVGDGRTHLRLTRQRYDVIVSEPSNPWIAGMAALFTREFFLAARARLADGGLMCQWAHAYDMREADLRSIVATFASVFPGATLWLVGESDVLLVGGLSPVEVSAPAVEARWASRHVATDLGAVRVSRPFSILSLLAADGDDLTRYVSGAPIQTDDRLALEYSGPAAVFRGARVDLAATFEPDGWVERRVGPAGAVLRSATAEDWVDRGRMLLAAEAPRRAFESFSRAVALAPDLRQAVSGLVDSAPAGGHVARATDHLARIVRHDPGQVTARIGYSRVLAASGRLQEAIVEARLAAAGDPGSAEALEHWAGLLGDTQQAAALGDVVARLVRLRPDSAETAYYAGTQAFLEGRLDAALASARRATAADPGHARAWGLAGAALAALGRLDEAREAFGSAVAADPRDPTAYANLGLVALNGGSLGDAARWFAESLAADAGYQPAREGLATTLERIGEVDRASRLRRGGR